MSAFAMRRTGRLIICGVPGRSPSVDMIEDRAADTLDLEMSLQLQMPGDPYYRAPPTCTIVSAPSILVRVDGAINGALVTGMAVVAGDHGRCGTGRVRWSGCIQMCCANSVLNGPGGRRRVDGAVRVPARTAAPRKALQCSVRAGRGDEPT